ncbi:hypothetical protein KNJ79_05105 [Sphingopyxis indica]|uniref:hypothetical protein n=1 Tax=Sphingopyxis indica TaxID=436663 RepID=UPI0029391DEF|nr:hypothetical protein [Sphingopyxis indica]WOF44310.1 hypothetical protein KNJ79_05105 [Sphingopyxis indica]
MITKRDRWKHNRLRKYHRKKFKRSDPQALKYWRYWHLCFGQHALLWTGVEE